MEQVNIEIMRALQDCGIDGNNPDTCGVCHQHFAECEENISCVGDETDEYDIPTGREFGCPGARARVVLYKIAKIHGWFDMVDRVVWWWREVVCYFRGHCLQQLTPRIKKCIRCHRYDRPRRRPNKR